MLLIIQGATWYPLAIKHTMEHLLFIDYFPISNSIYRDFPLPCLTARACFLLHVFFYFTVTNSSPPIFVARWGGLGAFFSRSESEHAAQRITAHEPEIEQSANKAMIPQQRLDESFELGTPKFNTASEFIVFMTSEWITMGMMGCIHISGDYSM